MDAQPNNRLPPLFRALESRNFRLFFAGQGISLIGTFLQQVALGWFVYRVTGSKLLLGTIAFASQAPSFLLSPIAGALADRWNRRKVLVIVQSLQGLQALALAIAIATDHAPIWLILAIVTIFGSLNAIDIPFRQSLVSQMLDDKTALPNAIALNSALFNSARLVGPALGGLLVASMGEATCFFLNAVSYLAIVGALLAIHPHPTETTKRNRLGKEILDGLRYVRSHAPIRDLLLLVSAVGMLGLAYTVLLPVMARDLLHGDARTLGLLMGSGGAGAIVGALLLASRKSTDGLLPKIALASTLSGVSLLVLSRIHLLQWSMPLIALSGFGFVFSAGGANTLIQTWVDNRFRGRVLSLYTLAFLGSSTIGNLAMGWLSTLLGMPDAMLVFGGLFLASAIVFALRSPSFRNDPRCVPVVPLESDEHRIPS